MITAHYETEWTYNHDLCYKVELQQLEGRVWQQRHTFYDERGYHVQDWIDTPVRPDNGLFKEVTK